MKKHFSVILTLSTAALLFVSCGKNNSFTITGTVNDASLNGKYIYLEGLKYDSTLIQNNSFSFSGVVDTPCFAQLRTEESEEGQIYSIFFIIEQGHIVTKITDDETTDFISGTPLNDRLQEFKTVDLRDTMDLTSEERNRLDSLYKVLNSKNIDKEMFRSTLGEVDRITSPFDTRKLARLWKFYHNNEENLLAYIAIGMLEEKDTNMYHADFVDSLVSTTKNEYVLPILMEKSEKLHAIEKTREGKPFVDINGIVKTSENGVWKEHRGSLKELIDGRLAVVDFWASWCGPCREEISENLINLSKKYAGKIVVVGVDVWDEIDAHAKAVADLGISYPQLIDTSSFATDNYGVEGIPEILLIGPDGTILERNLRGGLIEGAILDALKKAKHAK